MSLDDDWPEVGGVVMQCKMCFENRPHKRTAGGTQ